ncbi:FK506-binding protein 15-like [Lingula anatina]|uniref:peptidylprolyl isomerase n=1 Tax=Lingula anatina TaxID=7574 RepID=A0A1S3I759_LINAN|nr:FK506-binding protein 15-like [Lingula anatina]|eukprot:XP_013394043.1 FK506-binding protein 15-like [Lingula anatina]
MSFFTADDDDQDFSLTGGGSKLASIFGIDQASNQGGNESLKYTAPKQPRPAQAQPQGGAPAVLHACAVQTYKFVNNQYASQGKLGAAIVGSHEAKDYKLLLYVSKQQQVTTARISSSFNFTIQANNYANFYDDARQNWSLNFDSTDSAVQFAKHVALAKANSSGNALTGTVSQELVLGDGGALESGDSAEVKYTGWLLQNNTFGQVFDSNASAEKLFRFKVGKGKVIKGWDDGVIGMKKGSKRLLIIPPHLAYGTQGMGARVPPSSTLIFEVEIVRVKLSKEHVPEQASSSATPPPAASLDIPETHQEDSVKSRSKSITEQLSHHSSDKAKLISRMKKMGQPMLPLGGAVAAEPDTDEEPVSESPSPAPVTEQPQLSAHVAQPQPQKPVPAAAAFQPTVTAQHQQPIMVSQPVVPPMATAAAPVSSQVAVYQSQIPGMPMQPQFQPPFQQPYGYQQPPPPQYSSMYQQFPAQPPVSQPYHQAAPQPPPGGDVTTPILMSETRQQNTEIRLAIGKIADKVDEVHKKLDHLQVHGGGSSLALPGNLPNMEAGVLLQNIQRIIQENERLKKEIFEKSARIESQNEKIADLLQRNQSFVEQSNVMLEQRNDTFKTTAAQSQSRVLALEQEKVQLTTELSAATAQISTLQLEMNSLRKKEVEVRHQLSTSLADGQHQKDDLDHLRMQLSENEKKIEQLNSSWKEEKQMKKTLENKLSLLEEEMAELKTSNESLEKSASDRKKKALEEKKRFEEELEEVKSQYESEIQILKDRLRKQKSSTDNVAAEQVAQVEQELTQEWQQKCDRLVSQANDKHARALLEVKEEKQQLENTVQELQTKLLTLKNSRGDSDKQLSDLQEQVEDLKVWKEKYEALHAQAISMKQRYESRIEELNTEKEEAVTRAEEAEEKAAAPAATVGAPTASGNVSPEVLLTEVKKIMNSVYHMLRAEFQVDQSYLGKDILASLVNAIKNVTLKLQARQKENEEDEEEEEESEDEEDEEEEEEDEEEEEEDEEKDLKSEQTNQKEDLQENIKSESAIPNQDATPASLSKTSEDHPEPEVILEPSSGSESQTFPSDSDTQTPSSNTTEVPSSETDSPAPSSGGDSTAHIRADNDRKTDSDVLTNGMEENNVVEKEEITDNSPVENGDNIQEVENSYHEQPPVVPDAEDEEPPELPGESPDNTDPLSNGTEIAAEQEEAQASLKDMVQQAVSQESTEADIDDRPVPPPMNSSLFGGDDEDDDDLFGFAVPTEPEAEKKVAVAKKEEEEIDPTKDKPPPLFGDEDDDDDLDWLS